MGNGKWQWEPLEHFLFSTFRRAHKTQVRLGDAVRVVLVVVVVVVFTAFGLSTTRNDCALEVVIGVGWGGWVG